MIGKKLSPTELRPSWVQAAWERFIERTMRARVPPTGVFIKPSQIIDPPALKARHLEFASECSQNKCFRDKGALRELPWEPREALRGGNPFQFDDVQVHHRLAALETQAERIIGRV